VIIEPGKLTDVKQSNTVGQCKGHRTGSGSSLIFAVCNNGKNWHSVGCGLRSLSVLLHRVSKNAPLFNNSVKHWPISIVLARNIKKKLDVNDCSLAHLTLILSLHYIVKCRSRSLAVYNSEFHKQIQELKLGGRSSAESASRVETPEAPRRWGVGRKYPPPHKESAPSPKKFLRFRGQNGVFS